LFYFSIHKHLFYEKILHKHHCFLIYACNYLQLQFSFIHKKEFLNPHAFDSSVKPGDNFFQFANGKWFDTVSIPATEMGAGSFFDLDKTVRQKLKSILDSVSDGKQVAGTIEQKVGDFYASGMDSATIEKLGYEPVKTFFRTNRFNQYSSRCTALCDFSKKMNNNLLFASSIGADDKKQFIEYCHL